MKVARRSLGLLLAAGALLAMAWASSAPLRMASGNGSIVRISLGARPERMERCRTQTDEALAKVAPQMRQRVICEGVTARYHLELRRDGALLLSQQVRGGGLRHDRRLYVFRELAVPAGRSSFTVRLARIDTVAARDEADDTDDTDAAEEREEREEREEEHAERRRRREESVPAQLELTHDAALAPHEVLLVTYDPELRQLKAVRAPKPG